MAGVVGNSLGCISTVDVLGVFILDDSIAAGGSALLVVVTALVSISVVVSVDDIMGSRIGVVLLIEVVSVCTVDVVIASVLVVVVV